MSQQELKKMVAHAAALRIDVSEVFGLGSGSTVNCLIESLAEQRSDIKGVVPASEETARLLKKHGISVVDLNDVGTLSQYIDGADEVDHDLCCIKGRGAAMTNERVVCAASKKFICMIDESKYVDVLGSDAPVPIEVLVSAKSYISRQIVALGGSPVLRVGALTDSNHMIIDAYHLSLQDPVATEKALNNIPGVVGHGLFATQRPNVVMIGTSEGVKEKTQ